MRRSLMLMAVVVALLSSACYQDFDFDADHKADHVTFTTWGEWRNQRTGAILANEPGWPVPGDWNGDHVFDIALVTDAGDWVTTEVGTFSFPAPPQLPSQAGADSIMLPVPADYDGDGRMDAAWYRESDATWFIRGRDPIQFGSGPTGPPEPGHTVAESDYDFPIPADYDGDGRSDLATFTPLDRTWHILQSTTGSTSTIVLPGAEGMFHSPVAADFDGVGHAQPALYGPGGWLIHGHLDPITFGNWDETRDSSSFPAVADYDGDDRADLSYVTMATEEWHTQGVEEVFDTQGAWPLATGRNHHWNYGRFVFLGRCVAGYAPC